MTCNKGRNTGTFASDIIALPPVIVASLTNPEVSTAHIAKKIRLDLNDPQLLVDEMYAPREANRSTHDNWHGKGLEEGLTAKSLNQRYNISNDEAYDLLKENHQNKVRGMLGNLHVEHSLPALRLQWPFV